MTDPGTPEPGPNRGRNLGVVVIGRNEGERLIRCLQSLTGRAAQIVYVDSGSTDRSVADAKALGVSVVSLDMERPFTAARARNRGYERLRLEVPGLQEVQFVDGDTEVATGWLETAAAFLAEHPDVGVVCGGLLERHPERNAYHRLAQIEWNMPAGEIRTAGGNAMIRVSAFDEAGGYCEEMIAGEDPELCVRLREQGHRIFRLDHPMGIHDVDMNQIGQWWRRAKRDGHAYAEILYRHKSEPERYWIQRARSIVLWGGIVPLAALVLAPVAPILSIALVGSLGLLWLRILRSGRRTMGLSNRDAALYASHCVGGKIASCVGLVTFVWNRIVRGRGSSLIEHKSPTL